MASGPMVRSSYRAGELFVKNILRKRQAETAEVAAKETAAGLGVAVAVAH